MSEPTPTGAPASASDAVVMVADAIDRADEGYSIHLTGLSGSETEYTLDLGDGAPLKFSDIDDARDHALRVRSLKRAQAAIAAFASPPPAVPESVRRTLDDTLRGLERVRNVGGVEDAEAAAMVLGHAVDTVTRDLRTLLSTPSGRADTPLAGGGAVAELRAALEALDHIKADVARRRDAGEPWHLGETTLLENHAYDMALDFARAYVAAAPEPAAGGGREIEAPPSYGIIDPDYARVFTIARCLAWAEGYAMMMHGSFTRDLDLLAVPWTERACDPEKLVRRIEQAADLRIITDEPGQKPHGRLAWTLVFTGFGDPRFLDIGVMPRSILSAPSEAETAGGDT